MKMRIGKAILSFSVLVLLAAGSLFAQSNQGTIAGNVLDSTGAAVPHAAIVAKNRETGFTSTAESSGAGSYRFPTVPLGSYDISVKMPGFKAANYSGVLVQVNTVSTLDMTLEVGSSSEQVTVEASAPSVQSESSELGGVVTTKQVIELPLALGGVGALRSP
ncbi:MAG TPA: carboxypeptidase-like regulatory domain-containing protein, partial [Edaphobacter sp.]|nr:carboxypeptidase-like regulatory domain-containing protein [Edaphobacter sp.]